MLKRFCIAMISLSAFAPAFGSVITYNFNDGTLDGLTVEAHDGIQDAGYAYSISGGSLKVSAATGSASPDQAGLEFFTPFDLAGDFTLTVDASFTNLPFYDKLGVVVQGTIWYADADFNSGTGILSAIGPNGSPQYFSQADSSTSATFKISRTGYTITTSYNVGNGWISLGSVTDPAADYTGPVGLFLFQNQAGATTAAGWFDDLTIMSDSVPAPSVASSTLGFLGLLTIKRFRRDEK